MEPLSTFQNKMALSSPRTNKWSDLRHIITEVAFEMSLCKEVWVINSQEPKYDSWFGHECKHARKKIMQSSRLMHMDKNSNTIKTYIYFKTKYVNTIKTTKQRALQQFKLSLNNCNSLLAFWKCIGSLKKTSSIKDDISIDSW